MIWTALFFLIEGTLCCLIFFFEIETAASSRVISIYGFIIGCTKFWFIQSKVSESHTSSATNSLKSEDICWVGTLCDSDVFFVSCPVWYGPTSKCLFDFEIRCWLWLGNWVFCFVHSTASYVYRVCVCMCISICDIMIAQTSEQLHPFFLGRFW